MRNKLFANQPGARQQQQQLHSTMGQYSDEHAGDVAQPTTTKKTETTIKARLRLHDNKEQRRPNSKSGTSIVAARQAVRALLAARESAWSASRTPSSSSQPPVQGSLWVHAVVLTTHYRWFCSTDSLQASARQMSFNCDRLGLAGWAAQLPAAPLVPTMQLREAAPVSWPVATNNPWEVRFGRAELSQARCFVKCTAANEMLLASAVRYDIF